MNFKIMSDLSDVEIEITNGRSFAFGRRRSPPKYKLTELKNVANIDERHGLLSDISDNEGRSEYSKI